MSFVRSFVRSFNYGGKFHIVKPFFNFRAILTFLRIGFCKENITHPLKILNGIFRKSIFLPLLSFTQKFMEDPDQFQATSERIGVIILCVDQNTLHTCVLSGVNANIKIGQFPFRRS